jgi:hypothetical protein
MLIQALKELSDKEKQEKDWVSKGTGRAFWGKFIDYWDVFDLLELNINPEEKIGFSIYDKKEYLALQPLYKALEKIDRSKTNNNSDLENINSSLWEEVIKSATVALKVFLKNEEEAKKTNPKAWQGEDDWGREPECNH